jgi:hypothetical protein
VIDEDHKRLLAELEALPAYSGWWFAYEYPGLFCYHHPKSDRSVFFTPDWSEDGAMPIEVQDDEGTCVDYASIPLPHEGRTGQKLFDLVRPTLDKHQPKQEDVS